MTRLDFKDLREANLTRCEGTWHPIADWSETDWMCALAGEVGEAANLIKKRRRGEEIPVEAVADELADAMIYLDLLAARMDIDLEEAVRHKFNIVSQRRGSRVRL